jgi:hypothetical protein
VPRGTGLASPHSATGQRGRASFTPRASETTYSFSFGPSGRALSAPVSRNVIPVPFAGAGSPVRETLTFVPPNCDPSQPTTLDLTEIEPRAVTGSARVRIVQVNNLSPFEVVVFTDQTTPTTIPAGGLTLDQNGPINRFWTAEPIIPAQTRVCVNGVLRGEGGLPLPPLQLELRVLCDRN